MLQDLPINDSGVAVSALMNKSPLDRRKARNVNWNKVVYLVQNDNPSQQRVTNRKVDEAYVLQLC